MFNKSINEITYKDINELLYVKKEREGQTLDYKRDFHKDGKEFTKDATAFANAIGGYIVFGIDEKKSEVVGLTDNVGNVKIEDWITNVLNTNTDQSIKYDIGFIKIEEETPLFLVILYIYESLNKPVYATTDNKSICYLRKGTSVFSAKPSDIKEMYLKSALLTRPIGLKVNQKLKGSHNFQIGVNQGTIIKTDKVVKKNEVVTDPDIHISQEQAKKIKETINSIVEIYEQAGKFKNKNDKGKCFAQTWTSLNNKFGLTSYHLLPKEKYEEAVSWLQKQIAFEHRPKLRKSNNSQWKKDIYGAIYAKAQNELGLNKFELYNFAFEKLDLKAPISSLKDLSDVRLNKLYKLIFSH